MGKIYQLFFVFGFLAIVLAVFPVGVNVANGEDNLKGKIKEYFSGQSGIKESVFGVFETVKTNKILSNSLLPKIAEEPVNIKEIVRDEFGKEYVAGELVIKYKNDKNPFRVVNIPRGKSVREAMLEFKLRGEVEFAEPNYVARAFMVPNDTYYPYQWHLKAIGLESAWDAADGTGVIVAVIDTGIAYENYGWQHKQAPDLANTCFVEGYDFVDNDSHANDENGHGTHVAGTVAQSTNNGQGLAGVAFGSCLMPVKVLDKNGAGSYVDVAQGIRWAADNGAKVINLSLGGPSGASYLQEAVKYAFEKGVTVVAAAGNSATSNPSYPAAYDDYVIAVGATRYDNTLAPYSNYGSYIDLVAPGGDLTVDQNNDGYGDGILQETFEKRGWRTYFGYYFFQGTSMASPHVAGAAALVISRGQATSPTDVRNVLESTATDLGVAGRDDTYGSGLVNTAAVVNWTSNSTNEEQKNEEPPPSEEPMDQGQTGNEPENEPPVNEPDPDEIEVFYDSFEKGEWNGLWEQDFQRDWKIDDQRAVDGEFSAEVDGFAWNAALTSKALNLQGKTNAKITFSWFIERGLDWGEYLLFEISTDGGLSWAEKAILRGDIDEENVWHQESIELTGIDQLKIRFSGKMSSGTEDANVDLVKVLAY